MLAEVELLRFYSLLKRAVNQNIRAGEGGIPGTLPSSGPAARPWCAFTDGEVVISGRMFYRPAASRELEPGDRVIFLSESPFGACKTARLLDLRTQQVHEVECR